MKEFRSGPRSLALGAVTGIAVAVATWLATPTSANLRSALGADKTGTGVAVFNDSPTLITPTLGAASATSVAVGTSPATTGLLRVPYNASQTTVIGIKDSGATDRILIAQGGTNGLIRFGHYAVFDAAVQGINAYLDGSSSAYLTVGGTAKLTVTSSLTTSANAIAIGSTVASAGDIRLPNSAAINVRNSGNTGDIGILTFATATLTVGGSPTTVNINAGGSTVLGMTASLATHSTPATITKNAIGTTSTDGLSLDNTTAATVGTTVQYSTRLRQRGTAWNSVGAASETHDWAFEVRPATAAGATSSTWVIARSMAGAAYADCLSIASSGATTITGPLTVNGAAGVTVANASGYVGIGSGTMPTAGSVRFPVLGASGTRLVTMTDSGGTTRDIVYLYGTNQLQFGNGGNVSSFLGSTVFIGAGPANVGFFTTSGDFGGGSGVLNIKNATTAPTTNPTGGGLLYSEGGALKWRGSSGTVTTLAVA